jgi:hypothetical protein
VLIHAKIVQGTKGGCLMILDATSRDALPQGVLDTRLPQWMLPYTSPAVLSTYRPDLLLIDGLLTVDAPFADDPAPSGSADTRVLHPVTLKELQRRCVIHIVELAYTIESCFDDTLARKRAQHTALVIALTAAGWKLFEVKPSEYVHVVLVGSTGVIFKHIHDVLLALGLNARKIPKFLESLHIFAVQYAAAIVRCRRRLENTESAFHPTLPVLMDPP